MARVRVIDFRRPSKFARDQVRRLEHAHEGFCRSAASRMSAELRTAIELSVAASDQLPYVAAIEEAPQQAVVVVLELEPYGTQVAMVMELALAACLVDRMLGAGRAARTEAPQGLTDVEVAVLRRSIESLVEPLSNTWQELGNVRFRIAAIESSAVTVQLVSPSEPTLVAAVAVRVDGLESTLTLLLPYRSVEPVMRRIAHPIHGQPADDEVASAAVRRAMRDVEVELCAEVGAVELPLAAVRGLRPGDVVRLRRPAARGVVLRAGQVATYTAEPGRNGGSRAVQVRERWTGQ